MRIAICFFGLPPSKCGKKTTIKKDLSYGCWQKNVIKPNQPDIFIHSWGKDDPDKLVEKYSPVSCELEEHIIFDEDHVYKYDYDDGGGTTLNMFLSQAYSAKKSIELKKEYEKKHGFKYDIVMISRMDCLWFVDPKFEELDASKFYISNWNQIRPPVREHHLGEKCNLTTEKRHFRKILDYWFISNSENIDTFGGLYDYIPKWSKQKEVEAAACATKSMFEKRKPRRWSLDLKEWIGKPNVWKKINYSNHALKRDFLDKTGLWDKVEFRFYEHWDHNIQRNFYKFGDCKIMNDDEFEWK